MCWYNVDSVWDGGLWLDWFSGGWMIVWVLVCCAGLWFGILVVTFLGLMAICLGLGGFPGVWFGFWVVFVVALVWLGLVGVGWAGKQILVLFGNVVVAIGLGGSCF